MLIVTPSENAEFESHPRQTEILKEATDQGIIMRISVVVDVDVEFILTDLKSDIPMLKDRRKSVELEFVSPHFTPWDELFDLQSDGTWKLGWQWKISDIDGLIGKGERELALLKQKSMLPGNNEQLDQEQKDN